MEWRIKGTASEKGQALRWSHTTQPGSQNGFLVMMQRVELGEIRREQQEWASEAPAAQQGRRAWGRQGGGESRAAGHPAAAGEGALGEVPRGTCFLCSEAAPLFYYEKHRRQKLQELKERYKHTRTEHC